MYSDVLGFFPICTNVANICIAYMFNAARIPQ